MPDLTAWTTMQLVNSLVVAPASTAALVEIKNREIKNGDDDDDSGEGYARTGGIRPEHQPANP